MHCLLNMNIIKPERIRLPYPFLYLKPEKGPFWVEHPRIGPYYVTLHRNLMLKVKARSRHAKVIPLPPPPPPHPPTDHKMKSAAHNMDH